MESQWNRVWLRTKPNSNNVPPISITTRALYACSWDCMHEKTNTMYPFWQLSHNIPVLWKYISRVGLWLNFEEDAAHFWLDSLFINFAVVIILSLLFIVPFSYFFQHKYYQEVLGFAVPYCFCFSACDNHVLSCNPISVCVQNAYWLIVVIQQVSTNKHVCT